jgi:putative peptidoglycan lipid II flippase
VALISSARSFVTANALVAIALVIGFAGNIAMAALFGLTRRVDAFFAAAVLPSLFQVLFVDYLGKNFLPTLARARKESETLASELTSSIVTIVALVAGAVALALAVASRPLFELMLPGFSAEDNELVQRYFWIMAPAMVLMAVTVLHQYVCQHDEKFVRISAVQAVLPLANLVAVLCAGPVIGEYALPAGFLAGHTIVFALMAHGARYRYSFHVRIRRNWEGKIFTNSAIVMGSGLLARTGTLVTNYFGSQLGDGAISALAVALKLTQPLSRTIFTAVRMFMFSRTSRLAVDGNAKEIARLQAFALGGSFLLLAPLLWWTALNSGIIVETLLLRGDFDHRMAGLVSLALIGAIPYVLFDGGNGLMSNAFYAMDRVSVPALVMPLGTLIYLATAPWLSARYGVLGLTAGMSLSAATIFLILLVLLGRYLADFSAARTAWHLVRYTALAAICIGLPAIVLSGLDATRLTVAAVSLGLGFSLYVLVPLVLRDPLLLAVHRYLRKSLPAHSADGAAG